MFLFPVQWLTFQTDLKPEQVREKLQAVLSERKRDWFKWNNRINALYGFVKVDSFYLRNRVDVRFVFFAARFFGKIKNNSSGTTVKVFVRLHLFAILFGLLFGVFIVYFGLESYQWDVSEGTHEIEAFRKNLYVPVLIYIGLVISFKVQVNSVKRELQQILEARVIGNSY